MLMVLTEAENRKIAEGAEEIRRKHEAEEERKKTKEFREMKERNEKKPPEKPMPSSREFIRQKIVQGGERIGRGVTSFMAAPKPKPRQPARAPRRRAQPTTAPRAPRRRAAPRQPQPSRDPFGFGGIGSFGTLGGSSGSILGPGWGSAGRKKKKGGWGLL